MSIYYSKQIPGQLWLRDLNDNVSSAYDVLSSVYIKYKNINPSFFFDLSSNNINRFDVIYDTLFVETSSGFFFEKFYTDAYSVIQPYNQMNLFNTRKNTTVDYWYSEPQKKIYFAEIFYTQPETLLLNTFSLGLIFKSFDCNTGLASIILLKNINLVYTSSTNWDEAQDIFGLENPKITYNPDTKTFNVSFILRNAVGDFGLVSLNILDIAVPQISEVNGFLPYLVIDPINSSVTDWYQSQYQRYSYIITENGEFLLTENYINLITD
jgi:hypothetical protein